MQIVWRMAPTTPTVIMGAADRVTITVALRMTMHPR